MDFEEFPYRLIVFIILAVYVLNYFVGKQKNGTIAEGWYKDSKVMLETEYKNIGNELK